MNTLALRQTLAISFLTHAALVSSLSFSLLRHQAQSRRVQLNFLRAAMPAAAVHPQQPAHPARDRSIFTQKTAVPLTRTGQAELFSLPEVYVKPHRGPAFEDSRRSAQLKQPLVLSAPKKRDSSIMFHPLLPYQLQLYFNDRQAVHIELQFKTEPGQGPGVNSWNRSCP